MAVSTQWQLARDAAERYESILVPTLLGPAARALVESAHLVGGEAVLDVGCGTGAAARYAAQRIGQSGRVMAVDINPGMLEVAKSLPQVAGAPIEWLENDACQLSAAGASFDVVLCAQTLQFVGDRVQALSEMHRVLKPGGRALVSAWCAIEENPYMDVLVESIERYIGPHVSAGLNAVFGLSDAGQLRGLFIDAGFDNVALTRVDLDIELPNPIDFVPRHISATPMAAGFSAADPSIQQAIVNDVADRLTSYGIGDGARIPFRTQVATGVKAG